MDGALLDREAEVDRLRAGAATAGTQGTVVVLLGRAGTGKTRLLREAASLGSAESMRILTARASELEREYALGVARQLFEPLLFSASPQEKDRWTAGAARTAASVLSHQPAGGAQPGEFAAFHSLFWLVSNICQDTPLAMVIDDLQWADEPSLRFLNFLLPRLADLRLLITAGLRPDEPGSASHLIDLLLADPEVHTVPLGPLSAAATDELLKGWFESPPDPDFSRACHTATGGNPLLLTELGRTMTGNSVAPTALAVPQVELLGSRVLARRVGVELGRLPAESIRLAEAIAVLGHTAGLSQAANLADVRVADAPWSVAALQAAHVLRTPEPGSSPLFEDLDFEHPLIRSTLYQSIPPDRRSSMHARAARLLRSAGARGEQVAAHLLYVLPAGDPAVVAVLRGAAAQASAEGASEAAFRYLRRAVEEPPAESDRLGVLMEAGTAAFLVDLPAATHYLDAADELMDDVVARARLAGIRQLAHLMVLKDPERAVRGLTGAIDALPAGEDDLRRALEATLLAAPLLQPGWHSVLDRLAGLRALAPAGTVEGSMLDSMIANCDAFAGRSDSLERARRVVADPAARQAAAGAAVLVMNACFPLLAADPDEGITASDALIGDARETGSLVTLCALYGYRGWGWLLRGDLADADSDLREAVRLASTAKVMMTHDYLLAWLAEALVEHGRTDEAMAVLGQAGNTDGRAGPRYFTLYALALVLQAQGHHERALETALAAGSRFADHGGVNPAFIPWRSLAAECLRALGRHQEAADRAEEEVALARGWGGSRCVGRALRVLGSATSGPAAVTALEEAVALLSASSARLEHAKARVALGARLAGLDAARARGELNAGLELAFACGSGPLVEKARTELRATGARPRRTHPTGPQALTPSERRVAALAAEGLSNRQIAQELFVTAKTVEVHLSACYKKLGIARRSELHVSAL
ncbi:ATP-binding protein [Streptomyces sp. NPDC012935]|uniref:ATP-binding protein n=1 Tax=Streptomyces sp. NPDC012935 TaxID=3364857 RepID=UPI0036CC371F